MIKLKRKESRTDYGCPYKIILDGKKIGEIRNGEEVGLNVTKGNHTLQIKSPQFISNVLSFEADNDEFLSFVCYPKYTEAKSTKFLFKTFNGKVGISLEKESDFYL